MSQFGWALNRLIFSSLLIIFILGSTSINHNLLSQSVKAHGSKLPCVLVSGDYYALSEVDSTDPLKDKIPLLLIHGWNYEGVPAPPYGFLQGLFGDCVSSHWDSFIMSYNAATSLKSKYKLYRFDYWSNKISIFDLGGQLRDLLDIQNVNDPNFGNKEIVILSYSMGGLIARSFMEQHWQLSGRFAGRPGGDRVLSLITLGTPHHGTPLANGTSRNLRIQTPELAFLLNKFDSFLLIDPQQLNRSNLHWDNYENNYNDDGLLIYTEFPKERNDWLAKELNPKSKFNMKIIAYGGNMPTFIDDQIYSVGNRLLSDIFNLQSDGIVPLSSALFDKSLNGGQTRQFLNYSHSEMVSGNGTDELFNSIKADLKLIKPGICPQTSISFGQTVNGILSSNDCQFSIGPRAGCYYDQYSFPGTTGQSVTITMTGLDSFLFLLKSDGSKVEKDNDGAGNGSSKISLTLTEDDLYTIQATSFAPNVTGSYSLQLTSDHGGVPPIITRVSPDPVLGSPEQQPLTIFGDNFGQGSIVTLKDLTHGGTYTKTPISFNSTQITINANFTIQEANWTVQVTNPGNLISNEYPFRVTGGPILPTISEVRPNPVPGSDLQQPFTINGSGFEQGMNVILRDLRTGESFPNRVYSLISGSQLTMSVKFTNNTATWTVKAMTADGQVSNEFTFQVVASTTSPGSFSLTNQSPICDMTASGSTPALKLDWTVSNGADSYDVYRNGVVLSAGVRGTTFYDKGLVAGESYTYLVYAKNNYGTTASNSIRVPIPASVCSGNTSLKITNVSPNPVTGSALSQPFTVFGSGFVAGMNVTLRDLRTGEPFPNRPYTLVSGSQITLNPIFTNNTASWTVQAISPGGQSSNQYVFQVVESVTPPGPFTLSHQAPVCDTGSPVGPAVQLNWTASSGASTYDVYRNGSLVKSGVTGLGFYNTLGLAAGQSYSYFIQARNGVGTTNSNTITVFIPGNICTGNTPPGSFTLSAQSPVCDTSTVTPVPAVRLNWTVANGAQTYDVSRNGSQLFSGIQGTTYYDKSNLIAGQSYSYVVTARNSVGGTSSNTISVFISSTVCSAVTNPTINSFSPASGAPGTTVTIFGSNFTQLSAVRFNGVHSVNFTALSATQITAVVPTNATTGPIMVTTQAGSATSSALFTVLPPPPVVSILVDPASINFGTVPVGNSQSATITITNPGSSNIALTGSVGTLSNPFSVVSGNGSFSLQPGQSRIVALSFTPQAGGTMNANLVISHNAPGNDAN